ncbi:MAG: hypothetical protein KTR31_37635 [Myxococcales bacterium]|nr:hypothetical protein [Myxococcales bacterium]
MASPALGGPAEFAFEVHDPDEREEVLDLHQLLFDQLNAGVVDMDLSQTVSTSTASAPSADGVSTIVYDGDGSFIDDDADGQAWRWTHEDGSVECDVVIRDEYSFLYDTTKSQLNLYNDLGIDNRNLGSLLLHELGHCFTLAHNAGDYNIMGWSYTHVHANGSELYYYMGEYAADGLVGVYDVDTSFEDVGVVHWRYAGNPDGDAYSDHERTGVYAMSGDELPFYVASVNGGRKQPTFLVRRGHLVRPEFTFENNGSTYQVWVDVDYLLSTNDLITKWDTLLSSDTLLLKRDSVDTKNGHSVAIVATQEPGLYSLGARISDLVDLSDDVGQNNATYVNIEVLANGDPDYCEGLEPCARFEGDCDGSSDCDTGLDCIYNEGTYYGFTPQTDVCDLPHGSFHYCSEEEPCERFRGDCDSDDECQGGMVCVDDIGAQFGWSAVVDVCDYPLGHVHFCSPAHPCGQGEGDCDTNADCAFGTCVHNVGASYGFASSVDVCDLVFTP